MAVWTVEHGTFWAVDTSKVTASGLPPLFSVREPLIGAVTFGEIGSKGNSLPPALGDVEALAVELNLPSPEPLQQRLHDHRRCFVAKVDGQLAAYGWVTQGVEYVGELERHFNFRTGEAYVWDCGTLTPWRGQHLYSALLNHIIYQMHDEGIHRVWIGASRQNQPSIRGIVNAGFKSIVDVVYRRFHHLTSMWIIETPDAPRPLLADAYRILLASHERRIGRLFVGYKQQNA